MSTGMECGCSTYCNYDGPEAFSINYPRARKKHRCCECREIIPAGVEYERVWGIWWGNMDTFKTCMICVEIRRDYGGCAAYGHLREEIWNCLGVDYVTGRIREDDE